MSAQPTTVANCELCHGDGGSLLWRGPELRVVAVADQEYPAFLRVIWNAHVREMSDLVPADRSRLMMAVCKVETALRAALSPDKVNLASLGNLVPHLHWHVIPRFTQDPHFPNPIWGARLRAADPIVLARQQTALTELRGALAHSFADF